MDLGLLLLLLSSSIALFSSILALWTIYRMNRMNGYLKLILTLTISQFCYDLSIILVLWKWYPVKLFYIALRSMSGLWATFITNILSFVVLYTVWTSRVIDLVKNIRYILPTFFIPATLYGIIAPYVIFYTSDIVVEIVTSIYYWTRVASILFNICSYISMVYKLHQMDSLWLPSNTASSSSNVLKQNTQSPLWALAHRLKYYPIVQVITRLPVAIHEYSYGHDYEYPVDGSIRDKLSLLAYVLFLPAAGLGFFLVFITVCPGAYEQLKKDFKLFFCFICITTRTLSQLYSNSNSQNSFNDSPRHHPHHHNHHNHQHNSQQQKQQETISQLFSSRLSDTTEPSTMELRQRSVPAESSVTSDEMELRYTNSISLKDSPLGFKHYIHWDEEDLVAEIGRLYSVDQTSIVNK